jgi:prepilin-type N-terminal cleavage/methylation domain-containing protein
MKKKGFTLFEVLISLTIAGVGAAILINSESEKRDSHNTKIFIESAYDIIKAVDHRIAIDGYDSDSWNKTSWINENEIVNNLIKEDLTSKYSTHCSGGMWEPSVNSERETKLISCNHWKNRKINGEKIYGEILKDSVGFINQFNLYIEYQEEKDFTEKFLNIKKSIRETKLNSNQEISGTHYIGLNSKSTHSELTSQECINNLSDCNIKFSLNRNGGNEYIRADGANSMIGEHLTFIESKGQSPMKCISWTNTARDGSGTWSLKPVEDCGIGVYNNSPNPVVVDVVADNGTFKNILLDQECTVYAWNGTNVIDTGNTSPCGTLNSSSEVIQVVHNIQSEKAEIKSLYADNANIGEIFINNIIANNIQSKYAQIENKLKVDLIESYNNSVINFNDKIEINKTMTLRDILTATEEAFFGKTVYVAGDLNVTSNINANLDIKADGRLIANNSFILNNANVIGELCSLGEVSRTKTGELLSCISGMWTPVVDNTAPIGSIMLWSSYNIPQGWIELNGQSTAPYPKLRAVVGSHVIDMRGMFVRGLDRGRGVDSEPNRALASYQGDAIRNITGSVRNSMRSGTGGTGSASGSFKVGPRGNVVPDHFNRASYNGFDFDASLQVPTASENRTKNIALIYIIKAE